MKKIFGKLGLFLIFSRGSNSVRKSIVLILTNFIFLIGIIFLLECVLIVFGIGEIFLPFAGPIKGFLERMLF